MAGSAIQEYFNHFTRWAKLTLIQYSLKHKTVEFKVHVREKGVRSCMPSLSVINSAFITKRPVKSVSLSARLVLTRNSDCTGAPPLSLRRPLEIPVFAKLRALCLHSRYISLVVPYHSKRSLHVPPPIARIAHSENMNWSTSVYTTLSSDTEPSIVITFESAKYIFNAGENTTRAILQSKRGWKKVKALFLTQLGTQRSSGVPGVLLPPSSSTPNVARF